MGLPLSNRDRVHSLFRLFGVVAKTTTPNVSATRHTLGRSLSLNFSRSESSILFLKDVQTRIMTVTRTRYAALVSSLVLLIGCEQSPPAGAPRAPLPGEIKPNPNPTAPAGFQPKSMIEARKEREAKKAKEAADEAAKSGGEAPKTAPETPSAAPATPKPATAP